MLSGTFGLSVGTDALFQNRSSVQTKCMSKNTLVHRPLWWKHRQQRRKSRLDTPDSGANSLLSVPSPAPIQSACSSLRHMLLQTGLVREIHDWASAKAVELRHSQDVSDVVCLDLDGTAQSDFAFGPAAGQASSFCSS